MLVDFKKEDGLVPAVIQESGTGKVLMLGYMNSEALEKTLQSGFATFYSRSRNKLWVKGESSGHKLKVRDVLVDCDQDALVVVAEQIGPGVCHNGYHSCFYRRIQGSEMTEAEPRAFDPEAVYGSSSSSAAGRQEKQP